MSGWGNRHALAARSFHGLFWCALGKMVCAAVLVVIEYIGSGANNAPLAMFMAVLAAVACLVVIDRAYILRLLSFSSNPKWLAGSRGAGNGAIAMLAAAIGMFITVPVLSVFAVLEWPPGVTVCGHCARAAAVIGATGAFLIYIRTSQMSAVCAAACRSRPLMHDARHVLWCFRALLGAAAAAGVLLLLAGHFGVPRVVTALLTALCLAAQGFGLYCIIRHLMLLVRTAAVLDVTATESGDQIVKAGGAIGL